MANKGVYNSSSSIGRCDPYSNPYDPRMQSNPAAIRRRQENYLRSLDTHSSARLEKEIFLKIQEKGVSSLGEKFVALATIGKFVFLAITLPPYMLCYEMPKWIFSVLLSQLYELTTKLFRGISDKVSIVAHKFVNVFKNYCKRITSPILNFIQTRIEKGRELFAYMRGVLTAIAKYPYNQFKKLLVEPLANLFSNINNKIKLISKTLIEFPKNLMNGIANKSLNLWNSCLGFIKTVPQFFISWKSNIKNLVEKSQQLYRVFAESMKAFFQNPASFLKGQMKSFSNYLGEKIHGIFKGIVEPITQWLDPKLEAMKKGWEKVKSFKDKIRIKLESFWRNIMDPVNQAVRNALISMTHLMPIIPVLSFFSPLTVFAIKSFNYKKIKTVFKAFIERAKEICDSGLRQAAQWLLSGLVFTLKKGKKILDILQIVPLKLYQLLQDAFRFLLTALKGVFLIFSLMFAWARALIRYGMLLVRETAHNFFVKF